MIQSIRRYQASLDSFIKNNSLPKYMDIKEYGKELVVVILATIILAITVAFRDRTIFYAAALSFLVIFVVNITMKKIVGYIFQTDIKTKFWTWYQFGLREDWHFKKPIPMIWLPLIIALFTKGFFWWLPILEFDVAAKTERVSRRHGLYRFTQVTEHHMAWIAIWGLIANFVFAITGYILNFELFAKLSIYFIAWSVIPLSRLDGSKILFGGKVKWSIFFTAAMLLLIWALTIL